MKRLIDALTGYRDKLNELWHNIERLPNAETERWEEIRCCMYIVDVLITALHRAKPEDAQAALLKAFGSPGEWGYDSTIGQGLLEALKTAEPNPYRWRDASVELPDAEIQVLGHDGDRHQLVYMGDGDVWWEADNDEPCIFQPQFWRHLDNPELP